jgi:hypothetical protein
MSEKRVGTFDLETGEVLDGVAVWVGRRVRSPYGSKWMQVNQDALAEIAADPDMGTEAFRVFLYLNARLDFENLIQVPQKEMSEALRMKQPAISRAIRLLTGKQILLKGPKVGGSGTYRLNPHYGWKGKVQNLTKARQSRLRAVGEVKAVEQPATPESAS